MQEEGGLDNHCSLLAIISPFEEMLFVSMTSVKGGGSLMLPIR